jgi:hypothetical protein
MIRTVDEAYAAGARDAAADPPLTAEQVTAIAVLLAPYRPRQQDAACRPATLADAAPGRDGEHQPRDHQSALQCVTDRKRRVSK